MAILNEVVGAIGGFTWIDRGDAAPWLSGSGPVSVKRGDRVTVALDPILPVTAWSASAGEPGQQGEPGRAVGRGDDEQPSFVIDLPPGSWELALNVWWQYGDAAYYWTLEVTG